MEILPHSMPLGKIKVKMKSVKIFSARHSHKGDPDDIE